MKITTTWNATLAFEAKGPEHTVLMDSIIPGGTNRGMSPKQLLLASITGCTGMDIVSHMKKHKQNVESFTIEAQAEQTQGSYPKIFAYVDLTFHLVGDIDPSIALESAALSQSKYCGVSAMISKSVPIRYKVLVNQTEVGKGEANFS